MLSWRGHPTRLECLAVGYPPPKYSWKRADNRLSDGDFDRSDNASVLIITPTADTDFTNYTCIAENIIGQDITTFILKPIRKYAGQISVQNTSISCVGLYMAK